MKPGLQFKINLITAAVVFVGVSVLSSYFISRHEEAITQEVGKRAVAIAGHLARTAAFGVAVGDEDALAKLAATTVGFEDVTAVAITDIDGLVLGHSDGANVGTVLSDDLLDRVIKTGTTASRERHDAQGRRIEVVAPVKDAGRGGLLDTGRDSGVIGAVRLVFWPEDELRRLAQEKRTGTIIALLVLAAVLAASFFLVRTVTNPVKDLVHGTRQVAAGNLAYRVPSRTGDEIGDLARSFNTMADSLAAARGEVDKTNERFRSLIENSLDIITVIDSGGVVRYQSPSIERILGYEPVEMNGRSTSSFIHPDDLPRVAETVAAGAGIPGYTASKEIRFRHKDGTWRTLEVIGRNLLDDAAVGGIVVNSRDVTERQVLHAQILQAQKMEAIGMLAGGVAHDFNNILSVIMSYSTFLLDDLPADSPFREDVKEIQTAGERAAALTRQLLAFSRKQIVAPTEVCIDDALKGLLKMLGRLLGEHVEIVTDFGSDRACSFIDAGQLEQVFINLAVNARDAMPSGGTLNIRTFPEPADAGPDAHIVIAVTDTGTGMSRETLARIYEPFFTTKPKGKGTGLGLSTVFGIVEQAGGRIEVDSAEGAGTTFRVFLKRIEAATCEKVAETPANIQGMGETILLIEDEPQVRTAISKMLTGHGYVVVGAAGGEDALEKFKAQADPPHLIVSDVVMPGMSGIEAGRKLRALSPGLKILFMSGYTDDMLETQGAGEPFHNFVAKPFENKVLLTKIHEMLADRRKT